MTKQEREHHDREIRAADRIITRPERVGLAELMTSASATEPMDAINDGDIVPQTFADLLEHNSKTRACIESERDDEGSWHWVSASLLLPRHLSVTSQGRWLNDAIARLERQLNILFYQGGEAGKILGDLGWPDIPTVFAKLEKEGKI